MSNLQAEQPTKAQAWLSAMRLRTLPLALASILMGAFLAAANGVFSLTVTILCITTTIFLQVLSNFANDYGDSENGADSAERQGPSRAVQAGLISSAEMRQGMLITAILSMISGAALVWVSLGVERLPLAALFIGLGALSIWAAIKYTAGSNPYGYAGLGDISVFIFFGLVGVLGTYFLQAGEIDWSIVLPAISCGAFAVAVLNINNIRDMESDKQAGKYSIPVRIGGLRARQYHVGLLLLGVVCALVFVLVNFVSVWQFLFVLVLPLLLRNGRSVWQTPSHQLDPFLKQMALTSLLFALVFGLGQVLA